MKKKKSKLSTNLMVAYKVASLIISVAVAVVEIKNIIQADEKDNE